MTDTSQASLAFVAASTFGTTPASPAFKSLRYTSDTISASPDTAVSNEIRADATVSEVRRTGMTGAGDINFELHRNGNLEDLIAAAVRGTWATNTLKGALDTPHFTFEKKIEAGATDYYMRFEGARVGGMSLSITPEEYVTGTIKMQSAGHSTGSAILGSATYPAVAGVNGVPMIGVDVSALALSGAAGVDYLAMTLEVDNNLRIQRKIGSSSARGIGYGRRIITGTLQCYFENIAAYDLFRTDTNQAITSTVSDGTNSFALTIPRIKFTGGDVPNPGNDNDFILTLNWQATYDTTLATDIQIVRA